MSLSATDYSIAFDRERRNSYLEVDAIERGFGYAVSRVALEDAARVLACPVKKNPPCWQHGRVIYAVARKTCDKKRGQARPLLFLDVGTAKGFSALCMQWAIRDANLEKASVVSVDVVDPLARVRRNTVAEVDSELTLAETLAPWPEAKAIQFVQASSVNWLALNSGPIDLVFLDGKHRLDVVTHELQLLANRQEKGDVVILDDLQIPGVAAAAEDAKSDYDVAVVKAHNDRQYGIAVRL